MQISSFSLPLNPLWSFSKVWKEIYSSCKIYIIHINCFWWRWVGWTAIPAVNTLITPAQQQPCLRWTDPDYLFPLLRESVKGCISGCSQWGLSGRWILGRNRLAWSRVEERAGTWAGRIGSSPNCLGYQSWEEGCRRGMRLADGAARVAPGMLGFAQGCGGRVLRGVKMKDPAPFPTPSWVRRRGFVEKWMDKAEDDWVRKSLKSIHF